MLIRLNNRYIICLDVLNRASMTATVKSNITLYEHMGSDWASQVLLIRSSYKYLDGVVQLPFNVCPILTLKRSPFWKQIRWSGLPVCCYQMVLFTLYSFQLVYFLRKKFEQMNIEKTQHVFGVNRQFVCAFTGYTLSHEIWLATTLTSKVGKHSVIRE